MKNMITVLASTVLLTMAASSHAGTKWFVDRPAMMNGEEHYTCSFPNLRYGTRSAECRYDGLPSQSERMLLTDGDRQWVETMRNTTSVRCKGGLCTDFDNNYIGKAEWGGLLSIPRYYYVWGSGTINDNSEVEFHLYKRGTGPAADQFPGWGVENDTPPPPRVGGRGELEVHRYNMRYLDCSQGNDNQCLVEVGDYRELDDVTELGLFRVEDIKAVLNPADLGPDMDIFLPECWDGQCLTFKGVFMGWDPNYPAFQ